MIDRIGFVGGGQLARMSTEVATQFGFPVTVLDPNPNCPAAQVGAEQIQADYMDTSAVFELGVQSDVVTLDLEHVPAAYMAAMGGQLKWNMQPDPTDVAMIKDKVTQKRFLESLGIPVAPFSEELDESHFIGGGPYIIKLREGGFDGRGNIMVDTPADFYAAIADDPKLAKIFVDKPVYMEQAVNFEKELSVIGVRDINGAISTYPVVETEHKDGICNVVISPANVSLDTEHQARELTIEILSHLSGAGVYAIEMFLANRELMVNEMAPRVHNSGHLTIEANETSQFEQHIRAITGMELGSTSMKVGAAVMINILGDPDRPERPLDRTGLNKVLALPNTHPHLYGKNPRPNRKVGHITITGSKTRELIPLAHQARAMLSEI